MSLDFGELIRISLAAAYAVFALLLLTFPDKSLITKSLMVVALIASAVTLGHVFRNVAPWPSALALIFIVVLICGTYLYKRGVLNDWASHG